MSQEQLLMRVCAAALLCGDAEMQPVFVKLTPPPSSLCGQSATCIALQMSKPQRHICLKCCIWITEYVLPCRNLDRFKSRVKTAQGYTDFLSIIFLSSACSHRQSQPTLGDGRVHINHHTNAPLCLWAI